MNDETLKYLLAVKKLLSEPMPDQESELINHLRLVEAHYSRCGFCLAEANGDLDCAVAAYYLGVCGGVLTAAEKKAWCDEAVTSERQYRDKVQTLVDAIELRINLAQSILKQQRGERGMAR
jgi:hypothetical protein